MPHALQLSIVLPFVISKDKQPQLFLLLCVLRVSPDTLARRGHFQSL
jgi:hypothetical protein